MYVILGLRFARAGGFLRGLPARPVFRSLVRLSLPSGIQQLAFAAGFVATYWIVGQVGTRELAAASVLINVTLVAILPGIGLGLAAATLVGQALGREDPADAAAWGWDVAKVACIALAVLGAPMWLLPDPILGVFIHDPMTVEVGRWPMRLVGFTMVIEALGLVLMHSLMGAGDVRRVMAVAITAQWLVFLPLAYLAGPVLGLGLIGIWVMQGLYRGGQALFFYRFWKQGKWAAVEV